MSRAVGGCALRGLRVWGFALIHLHPPLSFPLLHLSPSSAISSHLHAQVQQDADTVEARCRQLQRDLSESQDRMRELGLLPEPQNVKAIEISKKDPPDTSSAH